MRSERRKIVCRDTGIDTHLCRIKVAFLFEGKRHRTKVKKVSMERGDQVASGGKVGAKVRRRERGI